MTTATEKRRYPFAEAMRVASYLQSSLAPYCERIKICGSLRRQKREVGDIEILYVSKPGVRQVDLLMTESYGEAEKHLDFMLYKGDLSKRPNKNGICAWGEKNKLAVHVASRIPVDLFATTQDCWWNSLVCRTGGKENNLLITTTAQRHGWSFEAYGAGFRETRPHGHGVTFHQTTSERDVFEFLGLPWLEPEYRK